MWDQVIILPINYLGHLKRIFGSLYATLVGRKEKCKELVSDHGEWGHINL